MGEAASIPLVGLTAWQALIERANLQRGQKVLIHAGSGGVGTFAIQLAKHAGAIVATTTSTANLEWVKRLGADIVIDYKTDDFETILRDYDAVLDTLGGETLEKSLRVLRHGEAHSISGPPDPNSRKMEQTGIAGPGNARFELSHQEKRKASSRELFISLHETQRRSIARDRFSDRFRRNTACGGSRLSVRVDQRGFGLRRKRTCKGQGRRQGEIRMALL